MMGRDALLLVLSLAMLHRAAAQDVFIGEIRAFGYNFCPRDFAECNGALMSIASNTALFSLLGTQFGGNGQTNFALPDLRGRTIVGTGNGVGLTGVVPGQTGGAESVTLLSTQMPAHTHTTKTFLLPAHTHTFTAGPPSSSTCSAASVLTSSSLATCPAAGASALAACTSSVASCTSSGVSGTTDANAAGTTLPQAPAAADIPSGVTGGSQPHSVRDPYLGMIYCIALNGIFPSRN